VENVNHRCTSYVNWLGYERWGGGRLRIFGRMRRDWPINGRDVFVYRSSLRNVAIISKVGFEDRLCRLNCLLGYS